MPWHALEKSLMDIDQHVGARVRAQRMAKGLSQERLATELGVTYQQIQKYESGKNQISTGNLNRIARALGVAEQFFFDGLPELKAKGFAESEHSPFDFSGMTPDLIKLIMRYKSLGPEDRKIAATLIESLADKKPAPKK